VIEKIKKINPQVPIIIYINKSGALLERMANVGVDIISLGFFNFCLKFYFYCYFYFYFFFFLLIIIF
jgi:hypothetical protein